MLHEEPLHPDLDISHYLGGRMPMPAELSQFSCSLIRDESLGYLIPEHKEGDKLSIYLVGFGMPFTGSIPQFNGISEDEFTNPCLKEFPEPFVHANRFYCTMDRFRKLRKKVGNLINAFRRERGSTDQLSYTIPDADSEGSFVKVNTNIGFCSHFASPLIKLLVNKSKHLTQQFTSYLITSFRKRFTLTHSIPLRRPASLYSFTLLEVLVVAAIIVIIAGIMIPRMAGQTERAKQNKAKAELAQLGSALTMVKLDNPDALTYCRLEDLDNSSGTIPTLDGNGDTYSPNPFNNWNGPYMVYNDAVGGVNDEVPNDPWGNDYILDVSTVATDGYATLKTLGKDGTDGTGDDITHKFM